MIAAVAPGPAAIAVTADLSPGAEPGRVVLPVSAETEIEVRRAGGTVERAAAADLVAGARIEARHTGAELRLDTSTILARSGRCQLRPRPCVRAASPPRQPERDCSAPHRGESGSAKDLPSRCAMAGFAACRLGLSNWRLWPDFTEGY